MFNDNEQMANLLTIILLIMFFVLLVLVAIWLMLKMKLANNKGNLNSEKEDKKEKSKSKVEAIYNEQSIFDFMEFDKIEDNMIIRENGSKYLMIIKCQGINYDLMSGVEKNSVEQGFLQYLNTLRHPIQIFVQTRTVDLTGSIATYKERIKKIGNNLAQKEFEYNQKVRSGEYSNEELEKERFNVIKNRNLYEYGNDIVNTTERMSLNKNILSKQYYIVIGYYPEEIGDYSKDEINNMAFSELYTNAQATISSLSICGINSKILDSIELADLLYTAYNRDEAEIYDLKKAINSGYDNIYITAPDVLEKRMKELDKQIEISAIEKANEAVNKVISEREIERKVREKEKNREQLIDDFVKAFLENNAAKLGADVVEKAKDEIDKESKQKKVIEKKEKNNVQEKTGKPGRPRKSA